jgi:hypothetical protein
MLTLGACGDDDEAGDAVPTTADGAGSSVAGPDDGSPDPAVTMPGSDRDDLPDACELVTEADAAELFGEPARRRESTPVVDLGAECLWENVEAEVVGREAHLLQVHVYAGEQFYSEQVYDDARALEGLGERAFVSTEALGGGVIVSWADDGLVFDIDYTIIDFSPADDQGQATAKADAVVELARRAADRV